MTRRAGGRAVAAAVGSAAVLTVLCASGAWGVALLGAGTAYAQPPSAQPESTAAAQQSAAAAARPTANPDADPTADPGASVEPAEVTLLDVSPAAPTATDVLVLSGTVTNTSGETLSGLNTYLRMSRLPATDRDGLARMTAPGYRSVFRPGPFEPLVDSLAAGRTATFQLEVPVSELELTTAGVYPVGVEILASFEDGTRSEVGSSITLVPWLPPTAGEAPAVDVAVAVPLMAAVDRAPDGSYLSERLGELFAPGGRLGALLRGSAEPGANRGTVTWLLDPALVEAAADLADGYEVRTDSTTNPGAHADDAADWLGRVAERARAGAVELLPYGNVDLVALVRSGLDADVAAAILAAPVRADVALDPIDSADTDGAGTPTVDSTVPPDEPASDEPPTNDPDTAPAGLQLDGVTMLYPPGGAVDAATLEVLAASGVHNLLLSDESVDADPDTQRVTVSDGAGSSLTAYPIDTTLGSVFDADSLLTSVQARQRALAYTAIASLDRAGSDSDAPLVVVVPPDPPDASGAAALDVLTGAAPWVTPVSLDAAMVSTAAGPATVGYPSDDRAAELTPAYLRAVAGLKTATQTLRSLTGDVEAADELDLARLRAESASWRDDPAGAARMVTELVEAVGSGVGAVRIVTTGTVTMSSDSGRFPLTVANDLDRPVTVRLALTARTPARLQTSGPELVEVAAGAKTTIDVSAKATTNGVYIVDAMLETADGDPFGAATPITVRATQYDTVAWVVMAAAGGLIVIGSGIRLGRRFRAARAPGA